MHLERDRLVRFVFPELRERCVKRHLHLVDVDLRWGVTEEEAEQGKALAVCLDEIERCRPFFVGLLGERYGFVPPEYSVSDELRYDWMRSFEAGHSITALEMYHGVLRNPAMAAHAFFYFRDPRYIETLPVGVQKSYVSENATAAQKVRQLKKDIKSCCRVKEYSRPHEAFGQAVLEDLWAAIAAEYPEEESPQDELAAERSYHEAFIEGRSQRFIGRRDLLDKLSEYAGERNAELLAVTGVPGCGKSALLANFARVYAEDHPDAFVLAHFIGASPGSPDIRRTLLRLSRELVRRFNLAEKIPEDYEGLRAAFGKILSQAAASGTPIVLIVDALDQLASSHRARALDWLPNALPPDVRVIVSTLASECLEALRRRKPEPEEILVGPLDETARSEIVHLTLWDYRKKLDQKQMRLLLGKQQSESPLYLTVVCEELRVFGEFERVTERIAGLPDDVPVLFQQMLDRLEHDHGRELVRKGLSLLVCSRHGLLENELLELLRRDSEPKLPQTLWARLYRSLKFYLRPPGETGEGELNFFHQQLAEAVRERYLISKDSEIAAHCELADYFRRKADPAADATWSGAYARGVSELPHHQIGARMWEQVATTLCDFEFIRAKCAAQMTFDLLVDYGAAIEALSGLAGASADHPHYEALGIIEGAIQLSAHVLARDADQLAGQLLGRLQSRDTNGARSLLDAARSWRGMPWLRPCTGSLTPPGETLVRTRMLTGHANGVSEVAITSGGQLVVSAGFYDHTLKVREVATGLELMTLKAGRAPVAMTPDGSLAISASSTFADYALKVWEVASGELLRTLAGHTGTVRAVAVTPDGRLAISTSADCNTKVWDVASGQELRMLAPCGAAIDVTPDGRLAISNSSDNKTLKVWEVANGLDRTTLSPGGEPVAMTPDGALVISGSSKLSDFSLRVWDVASGRELRTLNGHSAGVIAVAVTPDGRLAVSGSYDRTLRVWDIETGRELQILSGHTEAVKAVAVSPDGKRAVSASEDSTLRVWKLGRERDVPTSVGHAEKVNAVAMTPDGILAISASDDMTLKVWEASTGRELRTLLGHADAVSAVAVTPDGSSVISASAGALKVWEVSTGQERQSRSDFRMASIAYAWAVATNGRLAIAAADGAKLKVWDLTSERDLLTLAGDAYVTAVSIASDGRLAISASATETLKVWDLRSGRELRTMESAGTAVAMTPDGSLAISASFDSAMSDRRHDHALRVWDVASGRELQKLVGHTSRVNAVAVTPDGKLAISASDDQTLKVWDVASGNIACTFTADVGMTACETALDGSMIVAGDGLGRVHFLALEGMGPAR